MLLMLVHPIVSAMSTPVGAALGTTISQAISVLVSFSVIIKRKSVVLIKTDFKPHRPVMGKILSIGIPIAVQDGLIQAAFIVITIIANQRGGFMDYIIRKIKQEEVKVLDTFLYEAIFIPDGVEAPPKDIINQPELQVYVDDKTPSFAISLLKEYRNYGIGTELMKTMLDELKKHGYKQSSLAVQKQNYAVKMYKKVGFQIVNENEEEYIMVCQL